MISTQTGTTTELRCVAALGNGTFTREQAMNVTAAFSNVFIEDDQGTPSRRAALSGARLTLKLKQAAGFVLTSTAAVCVRRCMTVWNH